MDVTTQQRIPGVFSTAIKSTLVVVTMPIRFIQLKRLQE